MMNLDWWFAQGKLWGEVNTLNGVAIKAAFANMCGDLPWGEGDDAFSSFRAGAITAQYEMRAK